MSTVGRQIGPIPISTLINLWIQIYLIPIAIFPYAGFIAFYWLASSNYVLVTSSYDNQENIHKHQYYSNIYEIDMIESYLVSIICFFLPISIDPYPTSSHGYLIYIYIQYIYLHMMMTR